MEMRSAIPVELNKLDALTLRRWSNTARGRLRLRARIVLLAAQGRTNRDIAVTLRTDEHTVARWRKRFAARGLVGVEREAHRAGRTRRRRGEVESAILRLTRKLRRRGVRCSVRGVARELGINHMLVQRVWKDHGLAP